MTTPSGIIFTDPQAKPLSTTGQPQAGAYLLFFLTGTLTPAPVYADGFLATPLSQVPGAAQPSCTADSAGRFNVIYMNPVITYRVQLFNAGGSKLEDVDPYIPPGVGNAATLGEILFPQTPQEAAALVTPATYSYDSWRGDDVRRFGMVSDGVTDNTAALAEANSVGVSLYFGPGNYIFASNVTISVPIIMDYGAVLIPAANKTVTINGSIVAGPWQIFNCVAAGSAIAGRIRAGMYPVEWWGATGNGKTSSSGVIAALTTAFTDANAAFTSADVGKSIYIVPPVNTTWAPFLGTIAARVSATAVTLSGIPLWASDAAFTATCSGHTLTVSAVATGTLLPGQAVTGASAGTIIEYQLTGSQGSTGTYYVNNSQTIGSATGMTAASVVSYYYGTDDTAAITAANASVGQLATSAGTNVGYVLAAATTKLSFLAPNIYLMSGQALIGANPSTVAGQINTACAMQWDSRI